ncbi:hypothetical protein AB1285_18695 [Microbacterium sp. NRRL B-14842]|uniref:hypothetical protein n=1 Tax=Microbacterium sp. NRRL B-14842 TaxID=3162881 RepID=UPI003D27D6E3
MGVHLARRSGLQLRLSGGEGPRGGVQGGDGGGDVRGAGALPFGQLGLGAATGGVGVGRARPEARGVSLRVPAAAGALLFRPVVGAAEPGERSGGEGVSRHIRPRPPAAR